MRRLTAARTGLAAVSVWGHAADVFGEAVSHFMQKMEVKSVAFSSDLVEGEVGETGHAVFDLNWERLGREDGCSVFEDFCQGGRVDSMVIVLGDPYLEKALAFVAHCATAVDEVLFAKGNFGHMKMGWHLFTFRDKNGEGLIGLLSKLIFEFGNSHEIDRND